VVALLSVAEYWYNTSF
jgi:hypothetical protein